jgi:hypothetical protein
MAWGAAWGAAAAAIVAVIALFDASPGIESLPERLGLALLSGVAWGVRFGVIGAAIGTVFAIVVRLSYRGRRLADIDPVRFALLGALVGGAGVPLFLQAMNVLSGDGPLAWGVVGDDAGWAAVFGAVAAAGSILLARRADAMPQEPGPERIARVDDLNGLPAGARVEIGVAPRAHSPRS